MLPQDMRFMPRRQWELLFGVIQAAEQEGGKIMNLENNVLSCFLKISTSAVSNYQCARFSSAGHADAARSCADGFPYVLFV